MFRVATSAAARRVMPLPLRTTMRVFSSIPMPPTSNHPHTPFPDAKGAIIYTETDEAPALATFSLYPVISKVRKQKQTSKQAIITRWIMILHGHSFLYQYNNNNSIASNQGCSIIIFQCYQCK